MPENSLEVNNNYLSVEGGIGNMKANTGSSGIKANKTSSSDVRELLLN